MGASGAAKGGGPTAVESSAQKERGMIKKVSFKRQERKDDIETPAKHESYENIVNVELRGRKHDYYGGKSLPQIQT